MHLELVSFKPNYAFDPSPAVMTCYMQPGPRWVWIPVLLRVLFIPFFMLCNAKPATRSVPVVFSDYVYCVGSILMAFSSGYFSSLVMMYAPRYAARLARNIPSVYCRVL